MSTNASDVGSAVKMNEGVYFIRGTFVSVPASTIVLDPYSDNPSYREGLNVTESIISSNDDSSLFDNAKGFSNFAAPGADRLKITATLSKKSLTDTNDIDFVELIKVREGELKKLQDFSVYNELEKYLAARTFEESGNYSLDNFEVKVSDSLEASDILASTSSTVSLRMAAAFSLPVSSTCLRISSRPILQHEND